MKLAPSGWPRGPLVPRALCLRALCLECPPCPCIGSSSGLGPAWPIEAVGARGTSLWQPIAATAQAPVESQTDDCEARGGRPQIPASQVGRHVASRRARRGRRSLRVVVQCSTWYSMLAWRAAGRQGRGRCSVMAKGRHGIPGHGGDGWIK
ncbi:hypothetical protein EDB80DRAFT_378350 [Ilyonectria destructans]|nr:hypothetical protein EDB80DRAFT_378350 [Ilyonectria destructans]